VKVDPALWDGYDWSGRSIERHRAQIREELGFREATREDEEGLIEWLAAEIGVPVAPKKFWSYMPLSCGDAVAVAGL
jgi:hypothetical protein